MNDYRSSAALTRGPTARKRADGSPVWPLRVSDLPGNYSDHRLKDRGLQDLAGSVG